MVVLSRMKFLCWLDICRWIPEKSVAMNTGDSTCLYCAFRIKNDDITVVLTLSRSWATPLSWGMSTLWPYRMWAHCRKWLLFILWRDSSAAIRRPLGTNSVLNIITSNSRIVNSFNQETLFWILFADNILLMVQYLCRCEQHWDKQISCCSQALGII